MRNAHGKTDGMRNFKLGRLDLVLAFTFTLFLGLCLAGAAYAQAGGTSEPITAAIAAPAPASAVLTIDAAPSGVESFLVNVLVDAAKTHPWILTVISVMGALRLFFKPIMGLLESYVRNTPGKEDDEKLARFEAGPVYKWTYRILDYLGSIKLPTVAKAAEAREARVAQKTP